MKPFCSFGSCHVDLNLDNTWLLVCFGLGYQLTASSAGQFALSELAEEAWS